MQHYLKFKRFTVPIHFHRGKKNDKIVPWPFDFLNKPEQKCRNNKTVCGDIKEDIYVVQGGRCL